MSWESGPNGRSLHGKYKLLSSKKHSSTRKKKRKKEKEWTVHSFVGAVDKECHTSMSEIKHVLGKRRNKMDRKTWQLRLKKEEEVREREKGRRVRKQESVSRRTI
jgi:mevalonate pyrophosphate decarboxylase